MPQFHKSECEKFCQQCWDCLECYAEEICFVTGEPHEAMPELAVFKQFIDRVNWTYAKTMPHSPHEYIVKTKLSPDDQKVFEQFVLFIRANGVTKKYKKSNYVHFDFGGKSYWTMGAPLEITTIINRHELSFYDLVSDCYDAIFSDDESEKENGEVLQMFHSLIYQQHREILDIGCGTGLLLNLAPFIRYRYLGIDPSPKMISKLTEKHPQADTLVGTFEDFAVTTSRKFGFIASLFGSISYVNPAYFERLTKMLAPGGKFFLMFFKNDYFPLTYQRTGICFSHYKTDEKQLKEIFGQTFHYSNYVIATNIEKLL